MDLTNNAPVAALAASATRVVGEAERDMVSAPTAAARQLRDAAASARDASARAEAAANKLQAALAAVAAARVELHAAQLDKFSANSSLLASTHRFNAARDAAAARRSN